MGSIFGSMGKLNPRRDAAARASSCDPQKFRLTVAIATLLFVQIANGVLIALEASFDLMALDSLGYCNNWC